MSPSPQWITLFSALFLWLLHLGDGLECYACVNQDTNLDKCIKTTKQCEEHQDICKTQIKWGLPPYWTPYGDRMYYVDKDCDTRTNCYNEKDIIEPWCKRDWYDDWACIECCSGDLCNYYVTLGSARTQVSCWLVASALITYLITYIYSN